VPEELFFRLAELQLAKDRVGIVVSKGMGDGHVGLLYHAKDGVRILHMAWHEQVKNEALDRGLRECWIVGLLDIPPGLNKHLVSSIRALAQKIPKIGYGIDFIASAGSIKDGKYRQPRRSQGLTCASFVYEVLSGAAVQLIKPETWRPNDANKRWASDVCKVLTEKGASPGHVAAVREGINGLRLLPFEVSAAATHSYQNRPLTFDAVQPLCKPVESRLSELCKARAPSLMIAA